ncbi:MAG: AbrB/MazE/SpoVT family DNA-binding domain-containing protein, partial [Moorella sp. (in: Bacteria)]|nr:AbrB/MazE/SpoVT family DNA-binding domain-containing protein [Moorella sp. (in: firmicutes)]
MKRNLIITRLSSRGQVVIPKEVRKQLCWEPGDYVTVGVREGAVVMRCLKR